MWKKCESCKLYIAQQKTCQIMQPIMQGKINPDDYCSQYRDFLYQCERCNRYMIDPFIREDVNGIHTYCGNCIVQM